MGKHFLLVIALATLMSPAAGAAYLEAFVDVRSTEWPFGNVQFSDQSSTRPIAVSQTDYLYWGYGGESGAAAGGDPANATTWARAYARGQYGVLQSATAIVRAYQNYQAPTATPGPIPFPIRTEVRAINFIPELAILAGDDEDLTFLGPVCRGNACGFPQPSLVLQPGEGFATWAFFQDSAEGLMSTRLMTASLTVRLSAAGFEVVENTCKYHITFPSRPCEPLQGYLVRDQQGRMGVWFDPQFLVGPSYDVQGPFQLSYGAALTVSGRFFNNQGLRILFADPQELEYRYPDGFTGPIGVPSAAAVPEPATSATLGAAIAFLAVMARRRRPEPSPATLA
jgi:hypothetical protein